MNIFNESDKIKYFKNRTRKTFKTIICNDNCVNIEYKLETAFKPGKGNLFDAIELHGFKWDYFVNEINLKYIIFNNRLYKFFDIFDIENYDNFLKRNNKKDKYVEYTFENKDFYINIPKRELKSKKITFDYFKYPCINTSGSIRIYDNGKYSIKFSDVYVLKERKVDKEFKKLCKGKVYDRIKIDKPITGVIFDDLYIGYVKGLKTLIKCISCEKYLVENRSLKFNGFHHCVSL